MFPSLQYTDFHKFLVSVGGLTAGVGVAIPVLLLRSQNVLITPQKQLTELPPEAQSAVRLQQKQMTLLLHVWPYVTGFLVIVGLCLVVWGAVCWKKQQTRTDSREVAELAKLEVDREKTYQETLLLLRGHQEPPEAAAEALEEKLKEEEQGSAEESPPLDEASGSSRGSVDSPFPDPPVRQLNPKLFGPEARASRARGRVVMDRVIGTITEALGKGADITRDVRLGRTHIDAVITSRLASLPDLVLDVRMVDSVNNLRNRLNDAIVWAIRARQVGKEELSTKFVPVVFLVVAEPEAAGQRSLFGDVVRSSRMDKTISIASEFVEEISDVRIPLNVVIGELSSITPAALQSISWRTAETRVIVLPAPGA
ncbi:hypothetical protein [Micromonospora sp. S-DT3-3-22]|uniref:hypothetical protein n=1 Tax=Micromonospora sp. S-DT3-3-22 TaxID=2755359 RepID=UPI00189088D9|nr:hypothetical protein [Micromonospora sp. S-DT3-3-22]